MDYGKNLPTTGAGLMLGSVYLNQLWLVAAALLFIAAGAVAIRLGWRRGLKISD